MLHPQIFFQLNLITCKIFVFVWFYGWRLCLGHVVHPGLFEVFVCFFAARFYYKLGTEYVAELRAVAIAAASYFFLWIIVIGRSEQMAED